VIHLAAACDETTRLLGSFGVALGPHGSLAIPDLGKVEAAYVHHSAMPVAVTALARMSPALARGKFPSIRLVDLVSKRPSMDGREVRALAAVCGVTIATHGSQGSAALFQAQLLTVIEWCELTALFSRAPTHAINGIDVKPRGFDFRTSQVEPAAMAEWRRAYKALPPVRQMMAATILWLYRGGPDKTWLLRLPCSWHAADAINTLGDAGALPDWGKLVALYPGW
jgi:hypothetical protein